jgi:hypothetical protein
VSISVKVEPASGAPAAVQYRWDPDTDILTASLRHGPKGEGMSGSVELAGSDGSWLILDVLAGGINGVEIAVWPDVRKVSELQAPATVQDARVVVPARASQPGIASLEVDMPLIAEADQAERTIHFMLGPRRPVRTLRIANDILLDIDQRQTLAGVWLLNVPPFPTAA